MVVIRLRIIMSNIFHKIHQRASQHKKLIENFSYLSALQVFNILIPLITFPYLIRVLGKETYGLVVFAQAIAGYFVVLVGFGFNITATREVSIHRGDNIKLSEILSSVLIIKGVLLLISFIILSTLIFFIPQAKGYESLFYLSMWFCFYDIMFPGWYFQGIEQMKWITYISLIMRLSFVGLIFIFIRNQSDFLLVPIFNGIGAIIAGSVALIIIFKKHKIKFRLQTFQVLKYYFKTATPIFISNISSSLYSTSNKVIIGVFLGMEEVSYYDLAEKITNILKIPQSIISQTIFPKISKEKNIKFIKRMFKLSILVNIGLVIILFIFTKDIIFILGSEQMIPAQTVVVIISLTVPFIAMSNIFGVQILIPFGYSKIYAKIIIATGLIYLLQLIFLWVSFEITIITISIITLTTEMFVSTTTFYFCKKNNLWY